MSERSISQSVIELRESAAIEANKGAFQKFFLEWQEENSRPTGAKIGKGMVVRLSDSEELKISQDGKTAALKHEILGTVSGVLSRDARGALIKFENGVTVAESKEGTITKTEPASRDYFGDPVPPKTTVIHTSGLIETKGGSIVGHIKLPNGVQFYEGGKGWYREATPDGKNSRVALNLTTLPNGDREFKSPDDNSFTYLLKKNGEVQVTDVGGKDVWAPSGSQLDGGIDSFHVRDHFTKTANGQVYKSPDQLFSVRRTNHSLTIENALGTRSLSENGDLVVSSKSQGNRVYKANEAKVATYGGGYDREYTYPDGTMVTKFGSNPKETYMSVPAPNQKRQGVYVEKDSNEIVIQPVVRRHSYPSFNPMR